MIFVDDKQQEHDRSTKGHATNTKITSTTRHQKCFSTSNTKVKVRTMLPWSGQHGAYLDETLGLVVAVRRELLLRDVMTFSLFTNIIGYIFIVRRHGKQSKPTWTNRTLSLTQTELNVKIHSPHGPNTHAGADSQAFFSSCFKPNLLAAH